MPTEHYSIKAWAEEDRPREKMMLKGPSALSDAELLAIVIGSGYQDQSAVTVAQKLLYSHQNNLLLLSKSNAESLMKTKGIGEAKAAAIMAVMELGRRRLYSSSMEKDKPSITQSKDVFQIFSPLLSDLPYEEFWILLVSRANKVMGKYKISQGGISATITDVRLILKQAVDKLASGLILCHNHPSENAIPSKADLLITKQIKEAAALIEIQVLDHVIVCGTGYYSFTDHGAL